MSSILKALKKLEDETAQEIGGDFRPAGMVAGPNLSKRTGRFPFFGGSIIAGVSIIGVIAAIGLVYAPPPPFGLSDSAPASPRSERLSPHPGNGSDSIERVSEPDITRSTDTKPLSPEKARTVAGKYAPAKIPPPSIPLAASGPPPPAFPVPMPVGPQFEVYKKAPAAAPEAPTPARRGGAERNSPEPTETEATPATAHAAIPEKSSDESGLEIQALVWSNDPKNRLAVINGDIVKQGGQVGEAVVSFIGEDYILIRQEGGEWKARFQVR